ncbi:MAG: hypothetical protein GYB67_04250 [Chloroflexi bacterium]|nr:hypothetical protein [Chloroflexota bacterium]
MQQDAFIITRQHVAQVASFVGAAALLIGIIGLIWQGALTLLIGVVLAVGIGGIALWGVMTPREFVGFITGRQVRYSTLAFFSTLLLIGIVAVVYLLLERGAVTLDLTETQRFTLSPESLRVLQRVDEPIQITGFYSPSALTAREIDDQYFRLYEVETDGLITREYIDPEEQPALAQRYGVAQDAQVFISLLNLDGSVDLNTLARVPRNENQERDMTQAISRLLIRGSLTAYFATGHGERDPLDVTQAGISGLGSGLRESGFSVLTLNLPQITQAGGDIPDNADVVIFARPTTAFSDAEVAVIDRYLQQGGSLYLMADALFNEAAFLSADSPFNTYLWENFGIRGLDAVVVDPGLSAQTELDVISAAVFAATDIGARLDPESTPTLFRVARAVDVNLDSAPPDIANGRVIMSSPLSYGETDLVTLGDTNAFAFDGGEDLPGPLTTVVWAWDQTTDARILLVGDSDFATNGQVASPVGNGILWTDGVSWLSRLQDRLDISPQAFASALPLIFVDSQTLDAIAFLTIIMLPGVVLVVGFAVWARRRRK